MSLTTLLRKATATVVLPFLLACGSETKPTMCYEPTSRQERIEKAFAPFRMYEHGNLPYKIEIPFTPALPAQEKCYMDQPPLV